MALRRAVLSLMLLSGLRADTEEKEVQAMVGSNIKLRCIHPKEKSFDLNELHVYWQISVTGTPESVTYYLSGNSSVGHDNNQYKDRAKMSLDRMKQGDFSLSLYNITPQDEQKFNCLVFRNLDKILDIVVTLHVAANYSMPVVITPASTAQDEELTFTCMSTDGYPKPNVYWINKTDNSLLDEALQNSTVSLNARGLYDVVSVLKIRRIPNVNVGCCIENVLLHQNLTVSSQTAEPNGTNAGIMGNRDSTPGEGPGSPHVEKTVALPAVLIVMLVAVALVVAWKCRSRCPRWNYAGAQCSRPELELTDHV
ncbi:ICOS ligand isoform X2 [Pteronotus mesoamericanus]|uniref:ICOS ligand isoform X2 n=1 Tax=Pteronotus mesoamericanus TaxID=1884717 RepID=UPI0023EBD913|nr:ICOS ligand isoform X2 [Pteronotus parnellii mesoamericanus]